MLDDRVTKVSCMGTRKQGYYREELPISDFEVAIMHTAKDTVMRMAVSFNVRTFDRHWQHVLGTEGELETARSPTDKAKVWLADYYMPGPADVEWGFTSHQPAAPGAKGTTHDELDYYPLANFVQSIHADTTPQLDVYKAADTAAPAILAAESADNGNVCLDVPDFRPGPTREFGKEPREKRPFNH